MSEKELIPKDATDLISKALEYCESIKEITISNDAENAGAAKIKVAIKTHLKSLEAMRKGIVDPLNKEVKEKNNEFKPVVGALKTLIFS